MRKYLIILNFEVMKTEVFDISSFDWNDEDIEEQMFDKYHYNLTNCQWMITDTPVMRPINF
jgi:hypothetical protein